MLCTEHPESQCPSFIPCHSNRIHQSQIPASGGGLLKLGSLIGCHTGWVNSWYQLGYFKVIYTTIVFWNITKEYEITSSYCLYKFWKIYWLPWGNTFFCCHRIFISNWDWTENGCSRNPHRDDSFQLIGPGTCGINFKSIIFKLIIQKSSLTHWGRVTHICVVGLGHHWFR